MNFRIEKEKNEHRGKLTNGRLEREIVDPRGTRGKIWVQELCVSILLLNNQTETSLSTPHKTYMN